MQRDAAGLIVFDDEVRHFVPPSTRQGQLHRLLHGIEQAQPGLRTDFARPFAHLMDFLRRRGVVVAISDFWENPQKIIDTVAPLRFRAPRISVCDKSSTEAPSTAQIGSASLRL